MSTILGSVGDGGANAIHDVALVQAMLQAVDDAQGRRYFDSDYDGNFGTFTKDAIIAFQRDHGLFQSDQGRVAPGSATLQRLVALLPATLGDMRILKDTRIVYLAASQALYSGARARFSGHSKLRSNFRTKVVGVFDRMYEAHRIALTVNATIGHYRTFDQQDKRGSKGVGPGESYHNFGLGADVAFNTLHFIKPDGTTMPGGSSELNILEGLDRITWEKFWEARDVIARGQRLFPIRKDDRAHLQDDLGKSAGRSLVALLNLHRTMKWDARLAATSGIPNIYKSDLGMGVKPLEVGTARQIWHSKATLTKQNLAKALGVRPTQIKQTDVEKLKKALRAEFEWAERNYKRWRPI